MKQVMSMALHLRPAAGFHSRYVSFI